jgi:hypothetical protein
LKDTVRRVLFRREYRRLAGVFSAERSNHWKGTTMTKRTSTQESHTGRSTREKAAAFAVASVVGAAALAVVGAAAASGYQPYKGLQQTDAPAFKAPRLTNGELQVEGTRADDRIALRLKAGDPSRLQVDLDDNGSAEYEFAAPTWRGSRSTRAAATTASASTTPTARSRTRSRRRSTVARATTRSPADRAPSGSSAARRRHGRRRPRATTSP